MIEQLTPEQEAKMAEYVETWTNIGLSTKQFSEQEATPIINNLYTKLLDYPPHPLIYIADSPLEAWYAACLLCWLIEDNGDEFVKDKVRAKVSDKVWAKVWAKVRDNVGAKVGAKVWAKVGAEIPEFIYPEIDGNFSVGYFSFYSFFLNVLGVDSGQELSELFIR